MSASPSSRDLEATERHSTSILSAYLSQGKYQEALSYLEQASVGMRPHDNADVWSWRGEANLALGNLDKGTFLIFRFRIISSSKS